MLALSLLLSLCIYSLYFLTAVLAVKMVFIMLRRREGKDVRALVGTTKVSMIPVLTGAIALPVFIVGADTLGQLLYPDLAQNHVFALLGFALGVFLTAFVRWLQRRYLPDA